jgi:hypothetical protein
MDYEKLRKFVQSNDSVKVLRSGEERKLKSGDPDIFDLIEKAERFEYKGQSFTKEEFERLVEETVGGS